ncbi:hypothetical protein WJX79_007806 [Trebouxia sp. C0005]
MIPPRQNMVADSSEMNVLIIAKSYPEIQLKCHALGTDLAADLLKPFCNCLCLPREHSRLFHAGSALKGETLKQDPHAIGPAMTALWSVLAVTEKTLRTEFCSAAKDQLHAGMSAEEYREQLQSCLLLVQVIMLVQKQLSKAQVALSYVHLQVCLAMEDVLIRLHHKEVAQEIVESGGLPFLNIAGFFAGRKAFSAYWSHGLIGSKLPSGALTSALLKRASEDKAVFAPAPANEKFWDSTVSTVSLLWTVSCSMSSKDKPPFKIEQREEVGKQTSLDMGRYCLRALNEGWFGSIVRVMRLAIKTPMPWTTGHCVGLARALHVCSSLLMKPNHKLPTMLYALALDSDLPAQLQQRLPSLANMTPIVPLQRQFLAASLAMLAPDCDLPPHSDPPNKMVTNRLLIELLSRHTSPDAAVTAASAPLQNSQAELAKQL